MGNSPNNSSNNRQRLGNIINRVFESAGPDGKVRGTPQQIIDKYQALARDAQLAGDRVAAESFLQHSEHYSRMLGEAQAQANEARAPFERDDAFRDDSRRDDQRSDGRQDGARQENGRQDNARQDGGGRQDGRQEDGYRADSRRDDARHDGRRDDGYADQRRASPENQPQPAIASSLTTIEHDDADDGGLIDTPESGASLHDSRSEPAALANGAHSAPAAETAPDAPAEPEKTPKRPRTRRKARPDGEAANAPGE